MKVLLSCDDVLEAMTGSCGAAREDEALHEHLKSCADCRCLAEATEPALHLFADVMRAESLDRRDADSIAGKVFARLENQRNVVLVESHRRSFLSLSAHAWSQLVAAAAMLLALGGLFWAASPGEQAPQHELAMLPAFTSTLARATPPAEHGLLHLASLQLPEACLSPTAASRHAEKFLCCTRCHHEGETLPAVRLVAFSQQSCVACHKS
jgi:hypothetical protein